MHVFKIFHKLTYSLCLSVHILTWNSNKTNLAWLLRGLSKIIYCEILANYAAVHRVLSYSTIIFPFHPVPVRASWFLGRLISWSYSKLAEYKERTLISSWVAGSSWDLKLASHSPGRSSLLLLHFPTWGFLLQRFVWAETEPSEGVVKSSPIFWLSKPSDSVQLWEVWSQGFTSLWNQEEWLKKMVSYF